MKQEVSTARLLPSFVVAAWCLSLALAWPINEWDVLAYLGVVASHRVEGNARIQAFAYDTARAQLRPVTFQRLTGEAADAPDAPYRRAVAEDPEAFSEQLAFYRSRVLFVGGIELLERAGFGLVEAMHVLSGVAVFLGIMLLPVTVAGETGILGAVAVPILALLFGAGTTARMASPDGVAFLCVVGIGALFVRGRVRSALVLAPVAVLVRTELVLFGLLLAIGFLATQPKKARPWAWAGSGLAVATAVALMKVYPHPGWLVMLHHTFVGLLPFPLSAPESLGPRGYLTLLGSGLVNAAGDTSILVTAVLTAWAARSLFRGVRWPEIDAADRRRAVVIAAGLTYAAALLFLFPWPQPRLLSGPLLLAATLALDLGLRRKGGPTPDVDGRASDLVRTPL